MASAGRHSELQALQVFDPSYLHFELYGAGVPEYNQKPTQTPGSSGVPARKPEVGAPNCPIICNLWSCVVVYM